MSDAGGLRRIGGKDPLAGFFFHACLRHGAHQEHGVDPAHGLHDGGRIGKVAGHDLCTGRRQLPRGLAVRRARQGFDLVPLRKKGSRDGAALLTGSAGHQNVLFAGHSCLLLLVSPEQN